MYYVSKRLEISAAHRLELDYPSKCTRLHGHNWIVTVHCRAAELNANGMVTDFTDIKEDSVGTARPLVPQRHTRLQPHGREHRRWICDNVANCYRVEGAGERRQHRGIRKRLNGKSGKTNNKTMKKYRVNEIFYSLQGEGFYSGYAGGVPAIRRLQPRLSASATPISKNFTAMDADEIAEAVAAFPARHLVATGGEPLLQLDSDLLRAIKARGFYVQVKLTVPCPFRPKWTG